MTSSSTNVDVKTLPLRGKLQLLRDNAARPSRQPATIALCATEVLAHGRSLSDAETCAVHEQLIIASLECGQDAQATNSFQVLAKRFGRASVRVRRLQGLRLEASGATGAAKELYTAILKDSPTEPFVAKRLAAILRGEGKIGDAIVTLEHKKLYKSDAAPDAPANLSFMDVHRTDTAANRELIALHWLQWKLDRCIFYADECILHDPHSFLSYTRLAELCYANGDMERAATAYAQSLRLNESANNARAMYGLWLVAVHILKQSGAAGGKKAGPGAVKQQGQGNNAADLIAFTSEKLRTVYQGSPMLSSLDFTLQHHAAAE